MHDAGLELRLYAGFDLKAYLKIRWLGPDVVSVVNRWISFTSVFSCMNG